MTLSRPSSTVLSCSQSISALDGSVILSSLKITKFTNPRRCLTANRENVWKLEVWLSKDTELWPGGTGWVARIMRILKT